MRDNRIVSIGLNIKFQRIKEHLTQLQLAELANVSMETIQKIETGKQTPSIVIVMDIAKVLNVTIDSLCKNI